MPAEFDSDSSLEREFHSPMSMGSKGGAPANRGCRGRSVGPVPTQSGDSGRKRRLETDDESSEKESSKETSEESSQESKNKLPAKKPKDGGSGGSAKTPRNKILAKPLWK